ncbi:MAG: hypothetical protein IJ757_08865 [Clostridiales bacterium]|nr:hypothetical protein [Clostridiales bacterium]
MNNKIRKAVACVIGFSMMLATVGCSKNDSAEESMREELESLRAQLETQESTSEAEEAEETGEAAEQADEAAEQTEETEATETEVELRSWNLPFTVADGNYNLSMGQIAEGEGGFCYSLACVRVLDDIETQVSSFYRYDLPSVDAGKEVVYPIIQIYNASDEVLTFKQQDSVSLYADSVQVTPINLDGYYFSIDGVQGSVQYNVDPGREAEIVFPFIVDEGWTEITVFCDNASWTFTQDDVSGDTYTYASVFNSNPDYNYVEPDTVVYQGSYEMIFDGIEVDTTTYPKDVAVFEFTINNLTDNMLTLSLPLNMRGYQDLRMLTSTSGLQDEFSGHVNAFNDDVWTDSVIEIHPGMSSRVYIAYAVVGGTGSFECYFETNEDGVVTQVAALVQ